MKRSGLHQLCPSRYNFGTTGQEKLEVGSLAKQRHIKNLLDFCPAV
jgi:hypothetical protein